MGADRIAVLIYSDEDATPFNIQTLANAALNLCTHCEAETHFGPAWLGAWESCYLAGEPLLHLEEFAEQVRQEMIRPPHYVLTPGGQIRLWHMLDLPVFLDFYAGCWVARAYGY